MEARGWIAKLARDLSPGTAARAHLGKSQFALPNRKPKGSDTKGKYPVNDAVHRRAALGFCAMHHGAGSAECQAVRRAVEKRADALDWIKALVRIGDVAGMAVPGAMLGALGGAHLGAGVTESPTGPAAGALIGGGLGGLAGGTAGNMLHEWTYAPPRERRREVD